jgi:solute:Na+ symporter, SSS family
MSNVDIAVIIIYFLGITAAGIYFSKRNTTTEAYFLGNRNFPAWAIGLSLVGTSISSISFLAYPGDAFKTGWLRMLPNFTMPIAILIASIWILPFFRARNFVSAFEYLELRFGPTTRLYGAIAFCIAQLMRIGFILFLLALLLHEMSGWDKWVCILVAGIFVSFYTIMGGFEAVVWTDVVQTIVLFFGGVVCLFVILQDISLGTILSEASDAGKFKFAPWDEETKTFAETSWGFSFSKQTALMMLFIGFTNWMTEYSSNQNVVQRYCASRSTEDARRSMWICCITSIPIWSFFMFLGTALWVYYNHFPTVETGQMLNGELKADQILPYFILDKLPMGIAGLVIAAVMAAAMSSLDSSINAVSTVLVTDVVKRHPKKDQEDSYYLKLAHKIAVATSVVMLAGALIFAYSEGKTAQDTYTVLVALTAGGLLGLYFIGFFTTIADGRSIGIAIVFTFLFSGYRAIEKLGWVPELPLDPYYTGIFGNIIMFGIGLTLGKLMPSSKTNLDNLTIWTKTKQSD